MKITITTEDVGKSFNVTGISEVFESGFYGETNSGAIVSVVGSGDNLTSIRRKKKKKNKIKKLSRIIQSGDVNNE